MVDNKYVFAMYDVRGKQDYIFRGNKLKEIVGGSLVIRDIFEDELFPAAKRVKYAEELKDLDSKEIERKLSELNPAIFSYKKINSSDSTFSRAGFEKHINEGWLGEVVYDGGGNFLVLYKDIDTFKAVNRIFTKRVLERTYSLTVLCSCIEGVDFDNYTTLFPKNYSVLDKQQHMGDREKLYSENRKREARINPSIPSQTLPFTQVDYTNSLPLHKYSYSQNRKITREAYRKYEKYEEIEAKPESQKVINENVLDNIATDKGTDSWIAVIYIDGNNMGAKVQNLFFDAKKEGELTVPLTVGYEEAVLKLREFSNRIQKDYIDDRIEAIDKVLDNKYKTIENEYKRRLVVYAGDEINIIVNAHDAYDAVKAYFRDMPDKGSACAGIAIFKSHTPYSDAYHIAEQCCENAKKMMKDYSMGEANLMDFHYCQGVIGSDIDKIREREAGDIISKPWFVRYRSSECGSYDEKDAVTCDMVDNLVDALNTCSRTNIKGLLDCAKNSEAELFTELSRMQLRRKSISGVSGLSITELKGADGSFVSHDKLRKIIYDVVSVYDLWFRNEVR